MAGTGIKLCGLSRTEDILAVNRLKPDWIGFVFWEKSRRRVTEERAGELKKLLDPSILAVGVFVDEDPGTIERIVRKGIIDLVQLHGSETPEDVREVQERTGVPVIQAFTVRGEEDLKRAEESPADHILLDSGKGSGERFDWSVLRGFPRPFILAGGLGAENVGAAMRQIRPFGVDASSSLETEGKKDPRKMRRFVEAVRLEEFHGSHRK